MASPVPLEYPERLVPVLRRTRVLYADLDNTFTWKGSLFTTPDGPTLAAARTLLRLREIDVELVLVSGRNKLQMQEDARMMGCEYYIAELGALFGRGLQVEYTFPWEYEQTPKQRMYDQNTIGKLIEFGGGDLKEYLHWNDNRECSLILRGVVDLDGANEMLKEDAHEFQMWDNGVSTARDAEGRNLHVYHLMPRGVDKPYGVKVHRKANRIPKNETVFVGDALTDLDCGRESGVICIVSNGLEADPRIGPLLQGMENAISTTLPCAEGVEQLVELIASAKGV